ncbi:unnamed protein product [Linum trigynum]|uniref:Uncharacterized protein n=1 Tax=Linum trigynum TaxID=586398 RepID=A0AAV2CWX9_9ROSI
MHATCSSPLDDVPPVTFSQEEPPSSSQPSQEMSTSEAPPQEDISPTSQPDILGETSTSPALQPVESHDPHSAAPSPSLQQPPRKS